MQENSLTYFKINVLSFSLVSSGLIGPTLYTCKSEKGIESRYIGSPLLRVVLLAFRFL